MYILEPSWTCFSFLVDTNLISWKEMHKKKKTLHKKKERTTAYEPDVLHSFTLSMYCWNCCERWKVPKTDTAIQCTPTLMWGSPPGLWACCLGSSVSMELSVGSSLCPCRQWIQAFTPASSLTAKRFSTWNVNQEVVILFQNWTSASTLDFNLS